MALASALLFGRIAALAIDATYCYRRSSVGLHVCIVMTVSPAKTAEPIKFPFIMWSQVHPNNYVLDGRPDPQQEGALVREE